MTATILAFPNRQATAVFIDRIDGTPWQSRGFYPGDANAPWNWICATVAAELSCQPNQITSVEDDRIAVDGLPCYAIRIEPMRIKVNGRAAVVVDTWVEGRDSGYDYRFEGDEKIHWIRGGDVRLC